ncbi:FecCD family ABC transporter permease [Roseibium sp.]|uniref:FecCD family ABC transporter permease n=1 Tax=Roseibium sp. TaxID=1936156 RepID=UPI003A97F0E8
MTGTWLPLRIGALRLRVEPKLLVRGVLLGAVCLILAGAALNFGSYPVGVSDLAAALTGTLDRIDTLILLDVRLAHLAAALFAGLALGSAGAIFQALLRNPLATPDIIGFTAGASCGAVAIITLTGATAWMLGGAIAGGMLAALATFALSIKDGLSIHRLVLVGIGVSFTLGAVTDFLLTRTDIMSAGDASKWLAGSIDARSWSELALPAGAITALLVLALWLQYPLNRMQLGDDLAIGLGIPVATIRILISIVGIALTALAVSIAGPLPFVAFIAGPIAKRIIGTSSAAIFSAGLVGAVLTIGSDLAARNALGFVQLPTGVFTALVGAPYFLALLFFQSKRGKL